jgi:hypothetical protein
MGGNKIMTVTDWIVAIGTAVMAIVAIIAIFQDKIRSWLLRPKLQVFLQVASPDCTKTKFRYSIQEPIMPSTNTASSTAGILPASNETEAYFFRLRVANTGNQKAENVEVFAAKLTRRLADGTFKEVDSFLPMNLVWSYLNWLFFPAISPGIYKYCDLFHVVNPEKRKFIPFEDDTWANVNPNKTILSFDTIAKPYTKNYLVCPGIYHLDLTLAASNSKIVNKTLEINLTGDWFDDEKKMLGEGVGITLL